MGFADFIRERQFLSNVKNNGREEWQLVLLTVR
jgi:hypothetical protein